MSNTSVKTEDFAFVSVEEASRPVEGLVRIFLNRWWLVDEQGRIAFYQPRTDSVGGFPQCNPDVAVTGRLMNYKEWFVGVRHIPVVYRSIDTNLEMYAARL